MKYLILIIEWNLGSVSYEHKYRLRVAQESYFSQNLMIYECIHSSVYFDLNHLLFSLLRGGVMRKIIEKIVLAIVCYSFLVLMYDRQEQIGFLLASLILSLLVDIIGQTNFKLAVLACHALLFLLFPEAFFFYPLFVYSCLQVVHYWGLMSLLLLLAMPSPLSFILSVLAAYLAYQTQAAQDYKVQSTQIQNQLSQDKMALRRKQQQLEQDQVKNLEIATLSERNRIAHSLHDSIGHLISSSILQLEALQITTQDEATRGQLEVLSEHLQTGMTDIRQTLHQLYNESFDLRQRLEENLEPLRNRELTFHYSIESVLPLSVKLDFVTIVKELVTNCCKHSNSDQVRLVIVEQPTFYSLTYQDNGKIHPNSAKGIGLYSIEEIVGKYSGNLNIDQTEGYHLHLIFRKEAIA